MEGIKRDGERQQPACHRLSDWNHLYEFVQSGRRAADAYNPGGPYPGVGDTLRHDWTDKPAFGALLGRVGSARIGNLGPPYSIR